MPIDPRISLGVQPIQVADPIARYGQLSAIQNAQNQNALAQYQLGTAKREEDSVNALNEAYAKSYDPKTGKIDRNLLRETLAKGGFGSKLPAIEKTLI
jgi:Ca2+-binding EF-hand superfamily protein